MSISEILGTVCSFFNGRSEFSGVPFIKSPTNTPAPAGLYIAVGCDAVQQSGQPMKPGPGAGSYTFEQVANLYFVEVEGYGDKLRKVRNFLQTPDFIEKAAAAGFTVWEPAEIQRVDTFDGEFLVRQWRFTVTVNFEDVETMTPGPVIKSVETTINGATDKTERPEE